MRRRRVRWGFFWSSFAAVLWGFAYIPQELVWLNEPISGLYAAGGSELIMSSVVVAAVQSLMFAAVLFFMWSCVNNKAREVKRNLLHWPISKWFFAAGVFGGLLAMFGSVLAVAFVGADYASAMGMMCAVVGALYGRHMFREKLTKKTLAGILIISAGGLLVLDPVSLVANVTDPAGKDGMIIGYIGGIMAAVGWGIESCYVARAVEMSDTEASSPVRYGWECIVWFVAVLPLCGMIFGFERFFGLFVDVITNPNIVMMLGIVALTLGIADSLIHKSLPLIGVGRALSLNSLYVPISLVALFLFIRDYTIGIWLTVGVAIAIVGTFVMYWEREDIVDNLRQDR